MTKDWNNLTPQEKKFALLQIQKHDIGDSPGQWSLAALISRIQLCDLNSDTEIVNHFQKEKIKLPPTFYPKQER